MQQEAASSLGGGVPRFWRRRPPAWVWRAYAATALVVAGINSVNITTLMHDAVARHGLPAWKAVVWEASSGLMILLFAVIPLAALVRAMPGRAPWPRIVGVHLAASLLFSVLHVTGMAGLRMAIYTLMGESYSFGDTVSEFLYEYRKDVAVYALVAAIGWVALRFEQTIDGLGAPRGENAPALAPTPALLPMTPPEEMLEIRDGSRLVVARVDDILCAHAEGNYVALTLVDGRQPLMRATLTGLEQRLATGGFVRTHRSWLVNLRHLRESEPTGSGDFVLHMADGSKVPLSRRYGEAVRLIRKRSDAVE